MMKTYFEPKINILSFNKENIVTSSGNANSLENVVSDNTYITTESYNAIAADLAD